MYSAFILGSITYAQSGITGTWTAISSDSLFTLSFVELNDGTIEGHFKKDIPNQNITVYDSSVFPIGLIFSDNNPKIDDNLRIVYSGSFQDLDVTTGNLGKNTNQFVLLHFKMVLENNSPQTSATTAKFTLTKPQGLRKNPPVPIRFPSGLTFTKQ